MAQDSPSLDDLLRTAGDFLDDIGPRLDEGDRYQAQVAAFLISVARRELELGAAVDSQSRERWSVFLGADEDLAGLTRRLSRQIRAGELDGHADEALALLLRDVVDKVRIVRPDHLEPDHRG